MKTSVIKTPADYEAALAEIETLVERGVEAGSADHDRLEILAVLIGDYEERTAPIPLPDPLEAIRFRMEQLDLSQRDLIPFIGSRNRVSEVLSGKRPLTLTMIRALHKGLGIPATVLLQEPPPKESETESLEWRRFPLPEMARRGWVKAVGGGWRARAEDLMREFLKPLSGNMPIRPVLKRTRSARPMDSYALSAWCTWVAIRAMSENLPNKFSKGALSEDLLTELVKASTAEDGPLRAKAILGHYGIHLIVERHLAKTHLDGAALLGPDGDPIVGITARYDRLDNFWFCVLHEVIHIWRHMSDSSDSFIDDLDSGSMNDPLEEEADRLAGEALVPTKLLRRSRAAHVRTPGAVQALAAQLRVHPAIVAGRIRHDSRNYRILNQLIGQGEVRHLFPECDWPT